MKAQWPDSAVIYASLLNCFASTVVRSPRDVLVFRLDRWSLVPSLGLQDDKSFTTALKVRLLRDNVAKEESYLVDKTCLRSAAAFREIVCDRNYMEASDLRGGTGRSRRSVFDKWLYSPIKADVADRRGDLWSLKGSPVSFPGVR